jgi:hypothetical protein
MRSGRLIALTIAVGLFIPYSLLAHHSAATLYETGKKVILKGTVKQWVYSNPHCMLMLEVKSESGEVVLWTNETQAPSVIFPAGYRRDSFKYGQEVTITVEPFKNGEPYGRIIAAVLADGKVLGPATSAPPAAVAPQP